MKKVTILMLSGLLILGVSKIVYSQEEEVLSQKIPKVGIVDGRRIFEEHPEAKKAQELLKKELNERKKELENRSKEIRKLEESMKSNLLLSDEERAKIEKEIDKKKEEAMTYSQEAEEYLNEKEEELTKGITEKVYQLIKVTAQEKGIDIILENNYVLYADETLDITEDVIAKIKPKSTTEKQTTPLEK
ncbi:MAG: OmpH family outer membrane protein [bacterium]